MFTMQGRKEGFGRGGRSRFVLTGASGQARAAVLFIQDDILSMLACRAITTRKSCEGVRVTEVHGEGGQTDLREN